MRKVRPSDAQQRYGMPNAKVPFLAPEVVPKVLPAPVDGWDAISPLAEMDPKRAPILINWVPRPGFVELRSGYITYARTGSGAPVEALVVYRSPTATQLFAVSGSHIYDISVAGSSPAVVAGVTSARVQYVNFTPSGAATVVQLVNGVDPLTMWNGTAWTNPSITGLPVGFTTNSIIHIHAQKQRLWYILENSTIVAFMPTAAIMGPIAGTQDLGSLWDKGGFLMAMADWTIDGGSGPQDYVAFISSRGQVSLYQGTDPTNAQAWTLVGTFNLPPPIGRRCTLRIGSDVGIITQQGVLPISQALPFDPSADRSIAITSRIQNQMAQWAASYQGNFGWELALYPNQQLLFLNVPTITNNTAVQGVMNTLTGAWCQFNGWNANTFAEFNNNLYFGLNNGNVAQAYVSSNDDMASIQADMQCAFNWMDEPGRLKRMTMVQPLLNIQGITPTLAVDTDFGTSTATAPIVTVPSATGALWDVAKWDASSWSSAPPTTNYINWLSVTAIGHTFAMRVRANISGTISKTSVFDTGTFDQSLFDQGVGASFNPVLQINAFNTLTEHGGPI